MKRLGKRSTGAMVWSLCCLMTAGCRHEPVVPPLPPAMQTPGAFILAPPLPPPPSMQAALPQALLDETPIAVSEMKPRRRIRRASPGSLSVPVIETVPDGSSAAPSANAALGDLSPGGDSAVSQTQAANGITSVARRLNSLSADMQRRRPREVGQVRQFLKQASGALRMGDAEGAKNLATKAGLLLDDMQK